MAEALIRDLFPLLLPVDSGKLVAALPRGSPWLRVVGWGPLPASMTDDRDPATPHPQQRRSGLFLPWSTSAPIPARSPSSVACVSGPHQPPECKDTHTFSPVLAPFT